MIRRIRTFMAAMGMFTGLASAQMAQTSVPADSGAPKADPQAVEVLRRAMDVYRKCRTYQDQAKLILSIDQNGQPFTRTFDSKLLFARPNKIFYVWPSLTLVCDGRQCTSFYPDLQRQYTVQPAPPRVDDVFVKKALVEDFLTVVLIGLTSDKPDENFARSVRQLQYRGTREENDRLFHQLAYRQGTDRVELKIDAGTMRVDRITVTPESGRWKLQIDYQNVVVNEPIADSQFRFTPPSDAIRTERISFTRRYDYAKLGQSVPGESLPRIGTKGQATVDSLRGKHLTFVVFWATWCPPCREELPELQELYTRYRDQGFQVVAINVDSEKTRGEVRRFIDEMNFTFPNLEDRGSKVARDLAIESIPAVLVLDSGGKIVQMHTGISPESGEEYEWLIQKMIGAAPGATQPTTTRAVR